MGPVRLLALPSASARLSAATSPSSARTTRSVSIGRGGGGLTLRSSSWLAALPPFSFLPLPPVSPAVARGVNTDPVEGRGQVRFLTALVRELERSLTGADARARALALAPDAKR